MDGLLTYGEQGRKGFDLIYDPVDRFFHALGYVWDRVGVTNALDLLTCLLAALGLGG